MEEPELRERLLRRNAAEVYAFKPLIESHTRAQSTAKSLSARNNVLERCVGTPQGPVHHTPRAAGRWTRRVHAPLLYVVPHAPRRRPVSPKTLLFAGKLRCCGRRTAV